MCDICVVSDICSWEMMVIGCGVCVECLCVKMSMCVLCRSVWCVCVCSYMSCYVCVSMLCINRPGLGVFYCLVCADVCVCVC